MCLCGVGCQWIVMVVDISCYYGEYNVGMICQLFWCLVDVLDVFFFLVEIVLCQFDGLFVVGGDLYLVCLFNVYVGGIFLWFSEGELILWWLFDLCMVFCIDGVYLFSCFCCQLCGSMWEVIVDIVFSWVMCVCVVVFWFGQDGIWISLVMIEVYSQLYDFGFVYLFEVWDWQMLVGGIYGVVIGIVFFGESMFSGVSGGFKIVLVVLVFIFYGWGWELIDVQVENLYLLWMGVGYLVCVEFLQYVCQVVCCDSCEGLWIQVVGCLLVQCLVGG